MAARILRGQPVVDRLHRNIEQQIAALAAVEIVPTLAVVDATGDPSSALSASARAEACAMLGIQTQRLTNLRIPPEKDVDGLHPVNLGRLLAGNPLFVPATAAACVELLHHHEIPIAGKRVVIVGRSLVVGKPLALLMLAEDATVTLCHSRTRDLAYETRQAEILIVAAGQPELVTASMVTPGAVVLDVGTNVGPDGRVVGDVEQAGVNLVASALLPSKGGLGSVTTALLLWQVVEAARLRAEVKAAS
ncbi:bifunctional 5,10-methylene-tetrahydrofolate dehydrogenase/5,10-methylene-tetrahydrofolate cyclohydrolase [bacterium CPR1]|nr:bifunctional 5,10-methylene-tetrahydrofolate dehydrogenase/5,10-methylene-tetrahydrofolate cyclohydrolase [bacterium CPR1]